MTIKGVPEAIEFYKEAFGAKEVFRWTDPDGRVRHAEIVIGDSPIMLTDEAPDFGMAGPQSFGARRCTCSSTSRTWMRCSRRRSRPGLRS